MQVRKIDTKRLYALKYIRKANSISRSEVAHTFLFQINNLLSHQSHLLSKHLRGYACFHHSYTFSLTFKGSSVSILIGRDSTLLNFFAYWSIYTGSNFNVISCDLKLENIRTYYHSWFRSLQVREGRGLHYYIPWNARVSSSRIAPWPRLYRGSRYVPYVIFCLWVSFPLGTKRLEHVLRDSQCP
jgi:hypothetical protein